MTRQKWDSKFDMTDVRKESEEKWEVKMNFFEELNGSLICRENGETILIEPWLKNSFRVRAGLLSDLQRGEIALLPPEECGTQITMEEKQASITNGKLKAVIFIQREGGPRITYYKQNGELLLQEIAEGGPRKCRSRQYKALPGENYRLKVSFDSNPEEKLYGMGQYQQERMDLKGCNLELAHRNSQASIPFCISSLGYGFLWHNPSVGEVHFGMNTTEWVAQNTKQMDYWITAGDSPAEIEENYASVTGKVPMMPEYGLGFWQCKLRYYSQEEVLRVAREYKKRNIPLDVLVIDYYHWPRCGDFRFDEEFFPNPEAMVRELMDMGIETMVSVWPQVDYRSENYEEMKQQGLLVKSNSGVDIQMLFHGNNVFIDPTNPRTQKYVWEKCRDNYAALGINTFWLDEAEPEYGTYEFENYRYFAGPAEEVGNIYPREYARLFYEGQKEYGQKEVLNLVRCAWVGSQRYGTLVWSGDIQSSYEDLRKQICAGLHMGLSGIPWWTTDIGGFHGGITGDEEFHELLVRWFQFGTFCPVMRLHGNRQPRTQVVNTAGEIMEGTGADNEVWSFGESVCTILTKFIGIREAMRDYTRSLMAEAHTKGTPVMRTLFYEFPQDRRCWDITDSYMFGPDILVAPIVYKNSVKREVYLPGGAAWTLASTGEVYEGRHSYVVHAPLETMPVFLKNGRQGYLVGIV